MKDMSVTLQKNDKSKPVFRLLLLISFMALLSNNMSLAQDSPINLASGWDGNSATGAGSEPNKFGWNCTNLNTVDWGQANAGGVRYMDMAANSYLPNGRLMFVRWDGVGGSNATSVYSYPVQLEAGKTYNYSIRYTRHSNSTTDFVIGVNSAKDNSGEVLASGSFAPATQSFKEAQFKFVTKAAGTYYLTVGSSASGMLGAVTGLCVTEATPVLECDESSIRLNYFEEEKTITIFPNASKKPIVLSGFGGIKLSPATLPSFGGEVVVSSDGLRDVEGNIQVQQGEETLQIAVKADFPADFMPTQNLDTLTTNGAWCWFADPRAIYHKGVKEQTYSSWITTEGDIVVASYNHETNEYKQHTIWQKYQEDDHANPSLLIRDDGRIIIFLAKHFGDKISRFISTNPEDITSWGDKYDFAQTVTYPYPFRIGQTIYVFYRGGASWHPHLAVSTDNGETFSEPNLFITGGGQRPYARYCQGADGSIHVAVTTGHPRNEANNKIHYCRFKDNAIYRADGTKIKDFVSNDGKTNPVDINELEVVYNASVGKGWIWDITLEPETGYPVMVYASFPTDLDHRYHYARWDGTSWFNKEITKAGKWFPQTPEGASEPEPNYSGGIIFDYDDPTVVYLSKEVKGVFEIFKYTTPDKGETWNVKALTWNTPSHLLNVRPIVPRHHKEGYFDVIWMRGTYVYYGDKKYNTALVFPSASVVGMVSGIELSATKMELIEEEAKQLAVNYFPAFAKDKEVTWSSSDEKVATVHGGKVIGVGKGTAVITAVTDKGISASCEVTVKEVVCLRNAFFDFGTSDSPVATGAIKIIENTLLNDSYGWKSAVLSRNRATGDAELRDFNMGSSPTAFKVYLENGIYKVTVKQGDYDFGHDMMVLKANGEIKLANVTNVKGAIETNVFEVSVQNRYLELEFSDGGGSDGNWVVNSILIEQQKGNGISNVNMDFENPHTLVSIQDLSGRTLAYERMGSRKLAEVLDDCSLFKGVYLISLLLDGNRQTMKYICD